MSGTVPNNVAPAVKTLGHTKGKRITIMLHENPDIPPTGLFIGHNGTSYMLRPGEKVSVPMGVVGVLRDAVALRPIVNSSFQFKNQTRRSVRFPFDVFPDEEEVA